MSANRLAANRAPIRRGTQIKPRERILRIAAGLFREHGYRRTTVRQIAEAVGIRSGSLFHHFASKDEMLMEVMREAAVSVCTRAEEIAGRSSPFVERLRALVALELDCIVGDTLADFHAVLNVEWKEAPGSARRELTMFRHRYKHAWKQVLEGCAGDGLLRFEPGITARIVHGALGGSMLWFRKTGQYRADEYASIVTALVLAD